MEKVRPWCGQPSDRGRLKNGTEQNASCQRNTARIGCGATAATRRPPLTIDISCSASLSSKRSARRGCSRMMGQTDQTDGRTDARPFHRPCSAFCASSTNSSRCQLILCVLLYALPCHLFLMCWTQAQKGLGSNRSRDAVG